MKSYLFVSRKRPFDRVVIEFSTCKNGGEILRTRQIHLAQLYSKMKCELSKHQYFSRLSIELTELKLEVHGDLDHICQFIYNLLSPLMRRHFFDRTHSLQVRVLTPNLNSVSTLKNCELDLSLKLELFANIQKVMWIMNMSYVHAVIFKL